MTSSGVKSYDPTLASIIADAYHEAGVVPLVAQPSAEQQLFAREKLNRILSIWQKTPGMRVWTMEEGILFLQKAQRRYQLGSTSSDHFTDAYDFASTTLGAAAAAAASTITVASITGIAASDYLGIELDSGSFQWTTVNGAPSGTTVTPTAVLTGAAASGNRVIAYTSKLIRPLEMLSVRHFQYSDEQEIPVERRSHIDFMEQPGKTNTSSPFVNWRYQPKIPLGVFEVWLTPDNVDYGARFTYQRPLYDFTASTQTADVPIEWADALIYNLAAGLIGSADIPKDRAEYLIGMADRTLAAASGSDRENASICFQPDLEDY